MYSFSNSLSVETDKKMSIIENFIVIETGDDFKRQKPYLPSIGYSILNFTFAWNSYTSSHSQDIYIPFDSCLVQNKRH